MNEPRYIIIKAEDKTSEDQSMWLSANSNVITGKNGDSIITVHDQEDILNKYADLGYTLYTNSEILAIMSGPNYAKTIDEILAEVE